MPSARRSGVPVSTPEQSQQSESFPPAVCVVTHPQSRVVIRRSASGISNVPKGLTAKPSQATYAGVRIGVAPGWTGYYGQGE